MSDFHRASPEMAWLRLCRITNESTETKKMLFKFKKRVALAVELSIYYRRSLVEIFMLASHCPEVDTRWKHDDRNFHIRLET